MGSMEGILDAGECEGALRELSLKNWRWAFAPGQCLAMQNTTELNSALLCKKSRPTFLEGVSIQGVKTMRSHSLLPWLHMAVVIFTTAVTLYLLRELLAEFSLRRRR